MSDCDAGPSNVGKMECNHCQETFNRREHLERHLRRHSGARPYACPLCSRSFSRRDTLSRHAGTHGTEGQGIIVRKRGTTACQSCSKDKLKCSGGNPCVRCRIRGRNCVQQTQQPHNRTFKGRTSLEAVQNQPQPHDSDASTTSPLDDVHLPSPAPDLPSNQSHLGLNTDDTHDPQRDQGPLTGMENISLPDLNTYADFPWALDCGYFFPESYIALDHSGAGSTAHLDDFAPPSVPVAQLTQNHIADTFNSECPLRTEELSTAPSILGQQPEQRECLPGTLTLAAQLTDDDITVAENFLHVRTDLHHTYQEILEFYSQQTDPRFKNFLFPPLAVFSSFIQLYYEYFDAQLSFVHPSLLEQHDTPWILLLAVASVGCQYTKASQRRTYASTLTELLRICLPVDALGSRAYDTVILTQCTLLLVVNLMFTGFKDNVVNLLVHRAWLATLMRRFVVSSTNKDSLLSTEMNSAPSKSQWQFWIRCESERRLTYCFAVVDCFAFIFLGIEPSFTAGDYEQKLPSSDALWKACHERDWSSISHLFNAQAEPLSLAQIFSMNWALSGVLQQLSSFNKLILSLLLFVEESRVITATRSSALSDFYPEDSGAPLPRPPPSLSYRRLDWKYELLAPSTFSISTYPGTPDNENTFCHLLGILRHVQRKQLYTYSGWYASEEDTTAAEACLSSWMHDNLSLSRECAAHAGILIGEIRSTNTTACYHYFCLLIATSYLWAFTRLQYRGPEEHQQASQLKAPRTVLRIDQHHDPSLRERWVQGASDILVHVTGVGMLSDPGSAERLWKEFLQIVGSRIGWPTLREGMMKCTCALLNHSSPMNEMRYSNSELSQ